MKKIYFILVLASILFVANNVKSQVVDGITYQAVVVDTNGKEVAGMDINNIIIPNKAVNVRFTIIKGSTSGTIEYQETQTVNTDVSGLFSCVIGHGQTTANTSVQSILNVAWGSDKHFLKVEIDIKQNGSYIITGVQQMMAVPYTFYALKTDSALHAHTADSAITAQTAGNGTPVGGIIMYSGAWNFNASGLGTGTLVGWALCNGNNGTPDLTDKFVLGSIDSTQVVSPYVYGGSNTHTLSIAELPAHNHTISSLNFIGDPLPPVPVKADALPPYNPVLYGLNVFGDDSGTYSGYQLQADGPSNTGQCPLYVYPGTPTGTITGSTDFTPAASSINMRPAFVKLAFIMKL